MNKKFGALWAQAQVECSLRTHQFADFDFAEDYAAEVQQRFGELIVETCLVHVDTWTGTKYTPATDRILAGIKQEFGA
jgi:hypothetical protein